ncbi:MAG: hypothetical protein ACRCWQ_10150 [Bacilli bacterium]
MFFNHNETDENQDKNLDSRLRNSLETIGYLFVGALLVTFIIALAMIMF